ncbi:MAG: iron hydrogenase 1 [Firmicutes bacterium]|nr:iron hydrogenase 1 [Bacillota bacterium]
MPGQPSSLDLRPKILYQVAKAAWEGQLFNRREEICQLVHNEFKDQASRRQVANQIRIAMGLNPHDSDAVLAETDEEALMGMDNGPVIVANTAACELCPQNNRNCEQICPLGAIGKDEFGVLKIDYDRCLGEGACISACSFGALAEKSQFVPLINLLQQKTNPVYATVAPAFVGQFGPDVSPGQLRSALLRLGFTDVVETALYADLITIKEAFEFDEHVKTATDFMITSCCCPVWIKLIENKFADLKTHISPSVSPMVASGRVIKTLVPDAKVVFIGPCIAKKTEATLPDLQGAIDYVLTFQELQAIFAAADISPADQPEEKNPQASWSGRIYARAGGVSEAVAATLQKLVPRRALELSPLKVDGIPDCQKVLEQIKQGQLSANFVEGMACKGGCVGGPGRIIPPAEATVLTNEYGSRATAQTPVENPEVYAILARLGQGQNIPALTGESPMGKILARKLTNK